MRPSWHEYFMLIAKLVSTRSTCNSRPTGAVLVMDKQILATGYNGSMPGAPHCLGQYMPDGSPYCHRRALDIADVDKYNFCRASHAEANAIAQAARHGVPIKGATLYVTLEPCYVCMKLLATAQIEAVFFELAYESRDDLRDTYWKEAVAEAGFREYRRLTVSPEALQSILPGLTGVTSTRRLAATRGTKERGFIGAVEPD
jgi:dCMP deaminase